MRYGYSRMDIECMSLPPRRWWCDSCRRASLVHPQIVRQKFPLFVRSFFLLLFPFLSLFHFISFINIITLSEMIFKCHKGWFHVKRCQGLYQKLLLGIIVAKLRKRWNICRTYVCRCVYRRSVQRRRFTDVDIPEYFKDFPLFTPESRDTCARLRW